MRHTTVALTTMTTTATLKAMSATTTLATTASTPPPPPPQDRHAWVHVSKLHGGDALPKSTMPPRFGDDAVARMVAVRFCTKLQDTVHHGQDPSPLLAEQCWLKDHLALTSDLRTLYGRARCASALPQWWSASGLRLDIDSIEASLVCRGALQYIEAKMTANSAAATTATTCAAVSVVVRLIFEDDSRTTLWVMYTAMDAIPLRTLVSKQDCEAVYALAPCTDEHGRMLAAVQGHNRLQGVTLPSERSGAQAAATSAPLPTSTVAVIVGAGQAGLAQAARLQSLNVPYVLLERAPFVGDNWRNRYTRARFHTVKQYGSLPFLPYPKSYPTFLASCDMATHFELYATLLKLHVVTNTVLVGSTWDDATQRWTVRVRNVQTDQAATIDARYMIFCIGGGGQIAKSAEFANRHLFQGDVLHSKQYKTGDPWHGKRAVVIGSANTAHDIVEDLVDCGCSTVTMVQRSPTYILPAEYLGKLFGDLFSDDFATDSADQAFNSWPTALSRLTTMSALNAMAKEQPERFDALQRAGFRAQRYGDLYDHTHVRRGGHYIDVGASKRIADGEIHMAPPSPVTSFTAHGLLHADGSETQADVVVMCTGFSDQDVRSTVRTYNLVDARSAARMAEVGGTDGEGEVRGMYTNASHPGVFLHGGQANPCRFYAKLIATQIKLELEGQRRPIWNGPIGCAAVSSAADANDAC